MFIKIIKLSYAFQELIHSLLPETTSCGLTYFKTTCGYQQGDL